MIKKEKLSGADCMQSTPFSFRYEPIFLQKMGYKRTSSQGIRPDVEMLGADTAIEAKSIHDGVLQNFYDSIFCVIPLEKSDLILLILSLDTSTVQDARNFLDVLSEFRIDKSNIRMVINQVPLDDKKCELGISHVARILTMEPTCIIHTNQDARSFANVGEAASSDKLRAKRSM